MALHNLFGTKGEQAAFELLLKNGYIIRERNWRSDHHEVDIIAEKGNLLIFVEVKTRREPVYDISEVITRKKISNLIAAANAYIAINSLHHDIQFDVILLTGENENDFTVEYIEDAFRAPLRSY